MARLALGDSKLKARRRKRLLWLVGIVSVLICSFLGGLVWLSYARFLRITDIAVTGNKAVSVESIQTIVESELAHPYFRIFSKQNMLLYPKSKVEQTLLADLPTLSRVVVSMGAMRTLFIAVTEREPVALWCGDATSAFAVCRLLDKSGFAYTDASVNGENSYVRYYGMLSDAKQFLSSDAFFSLNALVQSLRSVASSTVGGVTVDENADVHLSYTNGFTLLFALENPASEVLKRLSLAQSAPPLVGKSLPSIEYIDLRFGDKLYYKLRGM